MRFNTDTCERPAEGWNEQPDQHGHIRYTMYGRVAEDAPEREGYKPFFVAVHGNNFTTWTYEPVEVPQQQDPWWVGRRDRDQLTGAYIPGTERQDPLTGEWH